MNMPFRRVSPATTANSGSGFVECILPVALGAALWLTAQSAEPWVRMWLIAGTLFFTFKWFTWRRQSCHPAPEFWKVFGYFIAWPGLDADEFFRRRTTGGPPRTAEWMQAIGKTLCGMLLLWKVIPAIPADRPRLIGALGMAGIVVVLHFGLFHLLALLWQHAGADVRPIMRFPVGATSVADFWGNRWNRAYRRASLDYFFRPCALRFGAAIGALAAFLISGLIHELVISVPADAGFGLPTTYFFIQGLGLLAERSHVGRQFLENNLLCGRLWTALVVLAPAGRLFHAPFLTRVVVPFLQAIGASPPM